MSLHSLKLVNHILITNNVDISQLFHCYLLFKRVIILLYVRIQNSYLPENMFNRQIRIK